MHSKILARFIYECRFKKWPFTLKSSSIKALKNIFDKKYEHINF